MRAKLALLSCLTVLLVGAPSLRAQDTPAETPPQETTRSDTVQPETTQPETTKPDAPPQEAIRETADELLNETQEKVGEMADQVDKIPEAQKASAGLLQPIYALAEAMAFPSFYWIAFMLMCAGVVSFALQLVFGKLVVLSKMSLSLREFISDSVGLVISLIGLVLTTQAATENSNFTQRPASVLSAAIAGLILGFILYRWGQREEVDAALGRKREQRTSD